MAQATFILDHHTRTVKVGYTGNLWQSFVDLEEFLRESTDIPFNSLGIVITDHNFQCPAQADTNDLTNSLTRFPIKFLSIFEDGGMENVTGPSVMTILEIVRRNSSTLEELEIRSGVGNVELFYNWEPPAMFEKLKKLSIAPKSSVSPVCAEKIILRAPNLIAIHNNCLPMLRNHVIPQDKYDTMKRLGFAMEDIPRVEEFAERLRDLGQEKDLRLQELIVKQERRWLKRGRDETNLVNKKRFFLIVQKVLALNAETLRSLDIRCQDQTVFSQLKIPMLPSIGNFYVTVSNMSVSLVHIASMNFPGYFPNLNQVRIRVQSPTHLDHPYAIIVPGRKDVVDMPAAPNAAQGTLELVIDDMIRHSDYVTLRRLFPNVTKLSIRGIGRHPPLYFIANLWPNLQSLRVRMESLGKSHHVEVLGELVAPVFGLDPYDLRDLRRWGLRFHRRRDLQSHLGWDLSPRRPRVAILKELEYFELNYPPTVDPETVREFRELVETHLMKRRPGLNFKVGLDLELFTIADWNIPRFGDIFEDLR